MKTVNILIVTPYLTGKVFRDLAQDPEELQKQIEKYGLEKGNFSAREIEENLFLQETKKHTVYIDARESNKGMFERLQHADLIIAGCTREQEVDTRIWSRTGLLIARCSMFYGAASRYTQRLPEQSGYAFDVPKSYQTLNSLFASDEILDALLLRNEASLRSAIDSVNRSLEQAVLCTPYLTKALTISEKERVEAFSFLRENPISLLRLAIALEDYGTTC